MRRLKDSDLYQIAEDILSEKVLTSNDLYKAANGNAEVYLHLLKKTFSDESLFHCMGDVVQAYEQGEGRDVLWFAYLTDNDEKKGFTKAYFIFGDDYRRLLEILVLEDTIAQSH